MTDPRKPHQIRKAFAVAALAVMLASGLACSRSTKTADASEPAEANRDGGDDSRSFIERIAAPRTRQVVVPEGTKIDIQLTRAVSSQTSRVGDAVTAVLSEAVVVDGATAIPAGSKLRGTVTDARPLPKIGGRASLAFSFDRLETPDGATYPIEAMFARTGQSETAKDATTIIAGAVIGAVAGHQVDDDQGRAVGGLAGAGIGTAIAASTDGQTIVLPESTRLRLTLRLPVPVQVKA